MEAKEPTIVNTRRESSCPEARKHGEEMNMVACGITE